jgi:hypothetical protein
MSAPSTTSGFAALLAPDLWEVILETGREVPLIYPAFMNEVDMPWRSLKSQQVAGLGTVPQKPEGMPFTQDAPALENQFVATPIAFGLAVVFSWEAWEDELYGVFRDMAAELARSSRYRLEVDAHVPLNSATNTAVVGFNASESLISTTHTSPTTSTVQANRPSPDVGFSVTGMQAALQAFYTLLNDRDLPQNAHPSTVIVHPVNLWAAREVLGSSGKPFTADNEMNSLIPEGLNWIIDRYITTNTNWFVIAPKGQHGMNFGLRTPPLFDAWDDPWTKNAVFSVFQRHVPWFTDWRGVYGSTG